MKAVDGVTLTIERGETLGLVGESGCGKSTLGRAILRLYEPTGGRIVFDGEDITRMSESAAAAAAPPDADGLPGSVRVAQPAPLGRPDRRRAAARARDRDGRRGRRARRASSSRSSGCRRTPRTATRTSSRAASGSGSASRARSRSTRDFIVCDEPVSALDVSIQAQIVNLLEDLQQEFGLTYLFIAHDLAVVRHISDRIAVMYLGKIVEVAPADDLYDNPLHPYTITLLSAIPIPDPEVERNRRAIRVQGDLPSPANPPAACRFHTRCPFVQPTRCRDEEPLLRSSTAISSRVTTPSRSRPALSGQSSAILSSTPTWTSRAPSLRTTRHRRRSGRASLRLARPRSRYLSP